MNLNKIQVWGLRQVMLVTVTKSLVQKQVTVTNSTVSCYHLTHNHMGGRKYALICVVWGTNTSDVPAACNPLFCSEMFVVYHYICNIHLLTIFIL